MKRRIVEFHRSGNRLRGVARLAVPDGYRKPMKTDRPRGHTSRNVTYTGGFGPQSEPPDLSTAILREARGGERLLFRLWRYPDFSGDLRRPASEST